MQKGWRWSEWCWLYFACLWVPTLPFILRAGDAVEWRRVWETTVVERWPSRLPRALNSCFLHCISASRWHGLSSCWVVWRLHFRVYHLHDHHDFNQLMCRALTVLIITPNKKVFLSKVKLAPGVLEWDKSSHGIEFLPCPSFTTVIALGRPPKLLVFLFLSSAEGNVGAWW